MAKPTRQRESLPKFDLVAANTAMNRIEAAVCVFELRGRVIGQAFIVDSPDNYVVICSLIIDGDGLSEERKDLIKTKEVNKSTLRYRRLFICPGCRATKWSLYFDHGWLCANCLGLLYRSQLIDKEVPFWEELDDLRKLLRHGRPKGMHNKTYMTMRQRLFALENRLRGRARKFASEPQNAIVQSRWVAGAEIDLWSTRYTVQRGFFVLRD